MIGIDRGQATGHDDQEEDEVEAGHGSARQLFCDAHHGAARTRIGLHFGAGLGLTALPTSASVGAWADRPP